MVDKGAVAGADGLGRQEGSLLAPQLPVIQLRGTLTRLDLEGVLQKPDRLLDIVYAVNAVGSVVAIVEKF
jgi:hypothetical protein